MKRIFCFILVLCLAVCTQAVTIIEIQGVVTSVSEHGGYSYDGSIAVGTTFIEKYYFDDLTDSTSGPSRGDYYAIYSSLSIGNYEFESFSNGGSLIVLASDGGGNRNYVTTSGIQSGVGSIYLDGNIYEFNSVDWYRVITRCNLNSSSNIPETDAFPTEFPDISLFDQINLWLFESYIVLDRTNPENTIGGDVIGEITSIVTIPEPCSLVLLGFGGLLLRRRG